jgi:hypothetical protein
MTVGINTTGTIQLKSSGGVAVISGPMDLTKGQMIQTGIATEQGEPFGESQPSEGIDLTSTGGGANGFVTYKYMPN